MENSPFNELQWYFRQNWKKKENRNLSIMAKLKRQSGETYKCNVFVHYFLQTNLDETLLRINFFFKKILHILATCSTDFCSGL